MTSSLNVARDGSASGPQDFKSQYPRGVPKCIANDFMVLKKQARARSLHNAIIYCKTHGNRPAFFLQNEKRRGQKTPCSEPGNPPYRQTAPQEGITSRMDCKTQALRGGRYEYTSYLFVPHDDSQLGRMRQLPAQRRPCAYAFRSSWRGPHKLHRRASLFLRKASQKVCHKMRRLHCHCMVKVQPVYPVFRRRAHD